MKDHRLQPQDLLLHRRCPGKTSRRRAYLKAIKPAIALMTMLVLVSVQAHSRVWAQEAGNARDGLAVAQTFCSECHAIRQGESRSPNSESPTFVEIANSPGITAAALLAMLNTPHAGMPMFVLTPQHRSDLVAYLLSLKEK